MFLSFFLDLVLSLAAFLDRVVELVRRWWPTAFPLASPPIRGPGVRRVFEDAKPAARRAAAYQLRVADRHDRRRPIPGLIFAV